MVNQANQMHDLSLELGSEITKMEDLLALIKSNWCGPASQVFQNQLVLLIADMRNTKNGMTSVSNQIKNVADKIQNEDERLAVSLLKK